MVGRLIILGLIIAGLIFLYNNFISGKMKRGVDNRQSTIDFQGVSSPVEDALERE